MYGMIGDSGVVPGTEGEGRDVGTESGGWMETGAGLQTEGSGVVSLLLRGLVEGSSLHHTRHACNRMDGHRANEGDKDCYRWGRYRR